MAAGEGGITDTGTTERPMERMSDDVLISNVVGAARDAGMLHLEAGVDAGRQFEGVLHEVLNPGGRMAPEDSRFVDEFARRIAERRGLTPESTEALDG